MNANFRDDRHYTKPEVDKPVTLCMPTSSFLDFCVDLCYKYKCVRKTVALSSCCDEFVKCRQIGRKYSVNWTVFQLTEYFRNNYVNIGRLGSVVNFSSMSGVYFGQTRGLLISKCHLDSWFLPVRRYVSTSLTVVRCLHVCVYHNSEFCRNGWADRAAVWTRRLASTHTLCLKANPTSLYT